MMFTWKVHPSWKVGLLAAGLLLALSPATIQAGSKPTPFSAMGVFVPGSPAWTINQGDVKAAGASGRFVVMDRTVTGFLTGDLAGPFVFTFGANVPITTQSGQFHGTLVVSPAENPSYGAQARGSSSLLLGPVFAFVPGIELPGLPPNIAVAIKLSLSGSMTFTDGAQGNGAINGTFTVAIDPVTGHILFLVPSFLPLLDITTFEFLSEVSDTHLTLDGKWHQ